MYINYLDYILRGFEHTITDLQKSIDKAMNICDGFQEHLALQSYQTFLNNCTLLVFLETYDTSYAVKPSLCSVFFLTYLSKCCRRNNKPTILHLIVSPLYICVAYFIRHAQHRVNRLQTSIAALRDRLPFYMQKSAPNGGKRRFQGS